VDAVGGGELCDDVLRSRMREAFDLGHEAVRAHDVDRDGKSHCEKQEIAHERLLHGQGEHGDEQQRQRGHEEARAVGVEPTHAHVHE